MGPRAARDPLGANASLQHRLQPVRGYGGRGRAQTRLGSRADDRRRRSPYRRARRRPIRQAAASGRRAPRSRPDHVAMQQSSRVEIDRSATAARIEDDAEALAGPRFTSSDTAIRRYAYIDAYDNTLAYFASALQEIGFTVSHDPVGTLVARNRP